MGRWIDVEANNIAQLADKLGSLESLYCRQRWGCKPWERQIRRTALSLIPATVAIIAAVQWVVSTGGSVNVDATTRSATSGPIGGMHDGRG